MDQPRISFTQQEAVIIADALHEYMQLLDNQEGQVYALPLILQSAVREKRAEVHKLAEAVSERAREFANRKDVS